MRATQDRAETGRKWVTVRQALREVDVPQATIYHWVKIGALESKPGARGLLVDLGEIRLLDTMRRRLSGVRGVA